MAQRQLFSAVVITIVLGYPSGGYPGPSQKQCAGVSEATPGLSPPPLVKEAEDNSRYKTLEANATLLKLLVDSKDGVSGSEVFDMLHSRDDNEDHVDLPGFPEDAEAARLEVPTPDSQAEYLQAPEGALVSIQLVRSESPREDAPPSDHVGAAAGIMILITCSIVCLAYTTLIVWRRMYLKRNGLKHHLLRNEENVAETRIEL